MPFRLTKEDTLQLAIVTGKLADAKSKIELTVQEYNQHVEGLRLPVEEAVTEYNSVLAEAREFRDGIVSEAQSDYDDKSEKWQETEAAHVAQEWISSWEDLSLDDLDYQWPDDLAIDEPDEDKELDALPKEA